MHEQYKVSKCCIYLVFSEHKLGIEIDENRHTERCKTRERERERKERMLDLKLLE